MKEKNIEEVIIDLDRAIESSDWGEVRTLWESYSTSEFGLSEWIHLHQIVGGIRLANALAQSITPPPEDE